jgi:hydroxylamine reductase
LLAGTVVDLVKKGEIKHFFFIGGCDGSEKERSYFKELAESTPKDTYALWSAPAWCSAADKARG